MSGGNTMMPGIIYTTNAPISTVNSTGVITTQQTIPCNGFTYALNNSIGAVNSNLSNGVPTQTFLRQGNKLYLQTNNTPILLNSINNTYIANNQLPLNIQSINGNLLARNTNSLFAVTLPEAARPSTSTNTQQIMLQSLPKADPVKMQPIVALNHPEIKNELQIKKEEEPDIIEIPSTPPKSAEEEQAEIDIMINNVVCSFSVGCHLDLRNIALTGKNVEFRRENGMVTMKLRNPVTTASIWSSGKITCTGSTAEDQARIAARRVARCLQKLGYNVRFRNYRIVNVLGTCAMPFGILIADFSRKHRRTASYEPELHPGVTYKIEHPKATLKIFSTGSITVTAPSVDNVQHAIEHIYPLVKEYSKIRKSSDKEEIKDAPEYSEWRSGESGSD